MKKHWAVVLSLLVIACTPEDPPVTNPIVDAGTPTNPGPGDAGPQGPDEVVVIPATPKGTVSGQVLNTRMEPLNGATVKLTIGSATTDKPFTTQSNAEGNFLFTGVPAGSQVLVTLSKDGYATLRATATVPASAGNVPIDNGNANVGAVALAETLGTVRVTLQLPSGLPAVGAQAYLEAIPAGMLAFNGGTATAISSVVATPVRADAMGVVTFTRMPPPAELARIGGTTEDSAGRYRLWVDPVDSNGDGVIDAAGYAGKIKAEDLLASSGSKVIRLTSPRGEGGSAAFSLVDTNVPSLQYVKLPDGDPAKPQMELMKKPVRNLVRPGDAIYLGFSQPVVRESLLAILADEAGKEQVELTVAASATGDSFTLTPPVASLREGAEYNLILRATSASTGSVKTWKGFFIAGEARTPRPLEVTLTFRDTGSTPGVLDAGECVIVTFNQVLTYSGAQFDVALAPTPEGTYVVLKAVPAAPPISNACFPADLPLKFPIDATNFNEATSRFYFIYGSPGPSYPSINPATGRARVDFTRFLQQEPIFYYETAWGGVVPSTTVLEVPVTK